jgi:hypothetical protein
METDLGIPSCLFGGPPAVGNIIKLGESQIGFMSIFARPLFEGITDLLPCMSFTVEELERNKKIWEQKIADVESNSTSDGSYSDSTPTNSKSTPHTSADATDFRSPSITSSTNGQISVSPQSVTATALPLQQIMEGLDTEGTNRGRISRKDTSVDPLSVLSKSDSPSNRQRALSAHQSSTTKTNGGPPSDQSTSPQLTNGLGAGFAASETDVRYLGKADKDLYLQENASEVRSGEGVAGRNGAKSKRLSQGFKRFFKRKWKNDQMHPVQESRTNAVER